MLAKLVFVNIVLFTIFNISQAQNSFKYCGQLLSDADSSPIADAFIVSSSGHSVFSQKDGSFCIETSIPGWIEVNHLTHSGKFIVEDLSYRKFYLLLSTYHLDSATVHFRYNRITFDHAFIKGNLPLDTFTQLKKNLHLEVVYMHHGQRGVQIHPITYLYDRYSKSAKRKAEYSRVIEVNNNIAKLKTMLNPSLLESIIKTSDPEQLNCFFHFISMNPSWVEDHSELEIIMEAKRCGVEFHKINECDWPSDLYDIAH